MASLTCLWMKRRLGPYLDGSLAPERARAVARHFEGCTECREEVSRLQRLGTLLRSAAPVAADPDWTQFWESVRRRILSETPQPWRGAWRWGWYPRLALGGALVGLIVLAALLWPASQPETPTTPAGVVVNGVETAAPNGNVMVFSSPEDDMTVIYVFGLEPPGGDQSHIVPASLDGGQG